MPDKNFIQDYVCNPIFVWETEDVILWSLNAFLR